MSPEIKLGIIGFGRAAELIYFPLLNQFPNVNIKAVVDSRKDRRELAVSKLNECKTYESICQEMLSEIDAAVILTPSTVHVPIAVELLKNEKFVLVEKPLSLNLDGIVELSMYDDPSNPKLAVGFNHRYWYPVNDLKRIISDGNEKVRSAEIIFTSDYSNWDPISSPSNPLDDLVPHAFDLIRYIFNDEIISIASTKNSKNDFNFHVKTKNEMSVSCRVAYQTQSKRTIKVETEKNKYLLKSGSERIKPTNSKIRYVLDFRDRIQRILSGESSSLKNSYKHQMEDFLSLNFSGKNKLAHLSDGIENTKSIVAAHKSLGEKGREVLLSEIK